MAAISTINLSITPGSGASEVEVSYTLFLETREQGVNLNETIVLLSDDRNNLGWIPKIIGNIVDRNLFQANGQSVERSHSVFLSNEELNEDPSFLDDYYVRIFIEPASRGGSARSNVVKRKF